MSPDRDRLPSNADELVRLAREAAERSLAGEGMPACVYRQFECVALAHANAGWMPGCTHGQLGFPRASRMLGMPERFHPSRELRKRRPGHWRNAVGCVAKLMATWELGSIANG